MGPESVLQMVLTVVSYTYIDVAASRKGGRQAYKHRLQRVLTVTFLLGGGRWGPEAKVGAQYLRMLGASDGSMASRLMRYWMEPIAMIMRWGDASA